MIKKVFPDAKFICLYRNCLDVVYSCISLSRMGFMSELCAYVKRHPENLVMAMIDSWMEKTRKILNFERDARFSCFRLTYESLVSSPDDTLCKLFSFLERSVDLRVINSIFSENYDFGQMSGDIKVLFSNKIYTDSIGKGSLIPRTYIPDDYMEEIANIETELGYPSLFVSNSHNIQKISSDIRNIVESDFPNRLKKNEHRLKPFVGTCKLIVTGDGGGEWFLDFGKRPWEFIQEKRDSDCSIAMSSKTLVELVEGKRNVIGVYESGHIGASGNIDMAIKIGGALFGYH